MNDAKQICDKAIEIVKAAGIFVMEEYQRVDSKDIRSKGKNDFVSYVDVETEKKLINGLKELIPEAAFMAEESASTTQMDQKGYYWIIDPIDGTTNYLYKIPAFCTSVALYHDDQPQIGIVYDMYHDECFYSCGGGHSFLDGQEIQVSGVHKLDEALLATGFPYNRNQLFDKVSNILKGFLSQAQDIRRLGSAALDLAYVACGRFEGFYEYNLHPWDVAAGAFIVQNAGGNVCDFSAGNNYLFGEEILATNEKLLDPMLDIIQNA